MLKCNAEFVNGMFRLKFETFWMTPYDPRRDYPVMVNFDRQVRQVSMLLGKTDLATASGAQLLELERAVSALGEAVRGIAEAHLFSPRDCAEGLDLVGRIRSALSAVHVAEVASEASSDPQ